MKHSYGTCRYGLESLTLPILGARLMDT